MEPVEPREVDVEDGPVRDELALGISQWSHRVQTAEKRARNLAFFGDQQGPGFDEAPGAALRQLMFAELCLTCGQRHRSHADRCPLSIRLARGLVALDETNCDHCLGHDHLLGACPVFHHRCQTCRLLGHIAGNCGLDSAEYQWTKYLSGCRTAVFASLEVEGPFAGPFGFGVYLTIEMTDDVMTIACEVRELAERQRAGADEVLLRARAPRCALGGGGHAYRGLVLRRHQGTRRDLGPVLASSTPRLSSAAGVGALSGVRSSAADVNAKGGSRGQWLPAACAGPSGR